MDTIDLDDLIARLQGRAAAPSGGLDIRPRAFDRDVDWRRSAVKSWTPTRPADPWGPTGPQSWSSSKTYRAPTAGHRGRTQGLEAFCA